MALKSTTTKNYSGTTYTNLPKTEDSTVAKINEEAKAIASKLKFDDRVERFPTRKAFITLKNHKPNFNNDPKCRFNNPAKSEIGNDKQKCLHKINLDNLL